MKIPLSPEKGAKETWIDPPKSGIGAARNALSARGGVEAFYRLEKEATEKEWKLLALETGELPGEEEPWVVRYVDGSWGYDPSNLEPFRSALMNAEELSLSLDPTLYTLPEGAFHPFSQEEKKEVLQEKQLSPSRKPEKWPAPPQKRRRKQEIREEEGKRGEEVEETGKGKRPSGEWLLTAFQNRDTDQRQMFEKAAEKAAAWQEHLEKELYGETAEEKAEKSMTIQGLEEQSKPLSQQDYAGSPAPDLTQQNLRHLHTAG